MLRGQQSQGQGEMTPSKEGPLLAWATTPCQESPGALAGAGKLQDTGRGSMGQSLALMLVQTQLFASGERQE